MKKKAACLGRGNSRACFSSRVRPGGWRLRRRGRPAPSPRQFSRRAVALARSHETQNARAHDVGQRQRRGGRLRVHPGERACPPASARRVCLSFDSAHRHRAPGPRCPRSNPARSLTLPTSPSRPSSPPWWTSTKSPPRWPTGRAQPSPAPPPASVHTARARNRVFPRIVVFRRTIRSLAPPAHSHPPPLTRASRSLASPPLTRIPPSPLARAFLFSSRRGSRRVHRGV